MNFIKEKLRKIQNSGDDEKKKWLVILSGISMVIVIFAWIFYMNNFVMKATPLQEVDEKVTVDIGFWQVFKTGLSVVGDESVEKIKTGFNYMLDKIPMFGKNNVTIENPR